MSLFLGVIRKKRVRKRTGNGASWPRSGCEWSTNSFTCWAKRWQWSPWKRRCPSRRRQRCRRQWWRRRYGRSVTRRQNTSTRRFPRRTASPSTRCRTSRPSTRSGWTWSRPRINETQPAPPTRKRTVPVPTTPASPAGALSSHLISRHRLENFLHHILREFVFNFKAFLLFFFNLIILALWSNRTLYKLHCDDQRKYMETIKNEDLLSKTKYKGNKNIEEFFNVR